MTVVGSLIGWRRGVILRRSPHILGRGLRADSSRVLLYCTVSKENRIHSLRNENGDDRAIGIDGS